MLKVYGPLVNDQQKIEKTSKILSFAGHHDQQKFALYIYIL